MDSLHALQAFVRAAETRSFTAAGHQLGVSSSAIGKAVARLEDRLGVRLLHRSTRTITVTPEGTAFLERCRKIFCEIEAAEVEIAQTQSAPRGKLRVSLPMASMLILPALTSFMRAYPDIELELDFSDRLVDIIEEGFDAVIRAGGLQDSRLMSRALGAFQLMLVASPTYLQRHGHPRTPADLQSHACLQHRFATSGKLERWPLCATPGSGRRARRRLELDLPTTAVANTIEPLIALAEHHLGITCLPDFSIRRQLAAGTLVPVLAAYTRHTGPFRILWPQSRHTSPKLRVFIDHMAAKLFPAGA